MLIFHIIKINSEWWYIIWISIYSYKGWWMKLVLLKLFIWQNVKNVQDVWKKKKVRTTFKLQNKATWTKASYDFLQSCYSENVLIDIYKYIFICTLNVLIRSPAFRYFIQFVLRNLHLIKNSIIDLYSKTRKIWAKIFSGTVSILKNKYLKLFDLVLI